MIKYTMENATPEAVREALKAEVKRRLEITKAVPKRTKIAQAESHGQANALSGVLFLLENLEFVKEDT